MRVISATATAAAFLFAMTTGVQVAEASSPASPDATIVVERSFQTSCVDRWGTPSGWTFAIGFTVPSEVTTGETFHLSDLSIQGGPGGDPVAVLSADGTDQGDWFVPNQSATVTAPAGGNVTISAEVFGSLFMGRVMISCEPIGDRHLVTIPVVAA